MAVSNNKPPTMRPRVLIPLSPVSTTGARAIKRLELLGGALRTLPEAAEHEAPSYRGALIRDKARLRIRNTSHWSRGAEFRWGGGDEKPCRKAAPQFEGTTADAGLEL
jgi:hypothetical protein